MSDNRDERHDFSNSFSSFPCRFFKTQLFFSILILIVIMYILDLRPEICANYFLLFPQKNLPPEKTETNKVFTFQFLNDKIDQNTNFAKLPSTKWLFCYNCKLYHTKITRAKILVIVNNFVKV